MRSLAVPITVAPRAVASWTATVPTPPAAPWTSTVCPEPTPSRSRTRVAVSTAPAAPPASSQLHVGGLAAHAASTTGFARAFTSPPPRAVDLAADRDRTLHLLLELMGRAKAAGLLRRDFVLEDFSLALMANEGIRAESPALRLAATRRFAALMIQAFRAERAPTPLPPPVRLPLSREGVARLDRS